MENMKNTVKYRIKMTPLETCNTCILLFIAIMIFISVMWMGGTLIGYGGISYDTYFTKYKPMIIISESMTPTIEVNALLLVDKTPYEDLKEEDIILFNTVEYGLVSHRIVDKDDVGFITKGDNNKNQDSWRVTPEMYKGKIAEIHNEYAGIITLLFGDLDNLNLSKLFLGFSLIAVFLSVIIVCLVEIYKFFVINYFLKQSAKYGGKHILEEYYPSLLKSDKKDEYIEIFDKIYSSKKYKKFKIRKYILKLHNILKMEERSRVRENYIRNTIRKDLK